MPDTNPVIRQMQSIIKWQLQCVVRFMDFLWAWGESFFPLNRCHQLPAPYKRLIYDEQKWKKNILNLTNNGRIETDQ